MYPDTLKYIKEYIQTKGANQLWEDLKTYFPIQYNMLLLASLEMQAKELENLKNVNSL